MEVSIVVDYIGSYFDYKYNMSEEGHLRGIFARRSDAEDKKRELYLTYATRYDLNMTIHDAPGYAVYQSPYETNGPECGLDHLKELFKDFPEDAQPIWDDDYEALLIPERLVEDEEWEERVVNLIREAHGLIYAVEDIEVQM